MDVDSVGLEGYRPDRWFEDYMETSLWGMSSLQMQCLDVHWLLGQINQHHNGIYRTGDHVISISSWLSLQRHSLHTIVRYMVGRCRLSRTELNNFDDGSIQNEISTEKQNHLAW